MSCDFCGCESCIVEPAYDKGYVFYQCSICGRYVLTEHDIMVGRLRSIDKDIIADYLYHNVAVKAKDREPSYACLVYFDELPTNLLSQRPHFHAEKYDDMKTFYPKTISERTQKILKTISLASQYPGDQIELSTDEAISLLFIRRFRKNGDALRDSDLDMQYEHIVKHIVRNEYANIANDDQGTFYIRLLAKGQEYVEAVELAETTNPLTSAFSSDYLSAQIKTMENAQEENPTAAIGMAKELIETCCKTIMQQRSVPCDKEWSFDKLVSETLNLLGLKAKNIDKCEPEYETMKKLLGSLRMIAECVNQLRNSHGGGHGKPADYQALSPRYAHLAVGSSTTFVRFLWETHKEQMQ